MELDSLIKEHSDFLYKYTITRVFDQDVAKDLVQDTFLAAIKGIGKFKGNSKVSTWLIGILKFKIIDHYRKVQKDNTKIDQLKDISKENIELSSIQLSNYSPEKLLESKDFINVLNSCLKDLPKVTREVFILKEMEGMGSKEICKEMDLTITNLWVLLHRGRERLRQCLRYKWFSNYEL